MIDHLKCLINQEGQWLFVSIQYDLKAWPDANSVLIKIPSLIRHDQILPIGGPGPAITPRQQGECLFQLLGKEPRFKSVPVGLLDVIVGVLNVSI